MFIDPEVFNSETYTEDADAAFYDRLSAALGDGYNIESLSQDGGYFEHTEYGQAIEAFRDQEGLSGSSNLQSITRDTLYEPVRKVYEEYRAKLGGRQEEVSTFLGLSAGLILSRQHSETKTYVQSHEKQP